MRILIFHGYLLRGTGSNIYNASLVRALVDLGHEVHLLCQDHDAAAPPENRPAGLSLASGRRSSHLSMNLPTYLVSLSSANIQPASRDNAQFRKTKIKRNAGIP